MPATYSQVVKLLNRYLRGEELTREEEDSVEELMRSIQRRAPSDSYDEEELANLYEQYKRARWESEQKNPWYRHAIYRLTIFVGVAVLFLLGLFGWLSRHLQPVPGSVAQNWQKLDSNGHAKPLGVTLPDGSQVKISRGSSLRYPDRFDGKTRDVFLRGEAAFEVVPNAHQLFVVHTDSATIEILGTHFDIRTYPGEPGEITLITGSLRVTHGNETQILKPSEQAVIENGHVRVHWLKDPESSLSWTYKTPYFGFDSTDLGTVVGHLARWYQVKTANPDSIHGSPITGRFPLNESLDVILANLNEVEKYRARLIRSHDTIYFRSYYH